MLRYFDIIFSLLALVILFPIFLIISLILHFTGEGEIFYLQDRVGMNGKKFKIIKFSTMLKNSPNMGSKTITMRDDPRILPVGKVLRKTKINELPQLLNIFNGDMSFVGPRPLTEQTFNSYSSETQKIVMRVKPGLSGIGSLIFRQEEEILQGEFASTDFYHNVIAPYKGELEKWFIKNQSLRVYFLVIFVTVWVVVFPSSKLVWNVFKNLPTPPDFLQDLLKYDC